jgi:hypothetical protein
LAAAAGGCSGTDSGKKTGVETEDASLESPNLASDYDGSRVDGGFAFGSKGTGMDAMVIFA